MAPLYPAQLGLTSRSPPRRINGRCPGSGHVGCSVRQTQRPQHLRGPPRGARSASGRSTPGRGARGLLAQERRAPDVREREVGSNGAHHWRQRRSRRTAGPTAADARGQAAAASPLPSVSRACAPTVPRGPLESAMPFQAVGSALAAAPWTVNWAPTRLRSLGTASDQVLVPAAAWCVVLSSSYACEQIGVHAESGHFATLPACSTTPQ